MLLHRYFVLTRWLMVGLVVGMLAVVIAGCGGGATCVVCPGAAAGWVYHPIGGGPPIVSARSTPLPGYEAVAGATVRIADHPALTTTTNANGHYYISDIPVGAQELVVEVPGQPRLVLSIPIIAGRVTMGSGHEEGGGGVF